MALVTIVVILILVGFLLWVLPMLPISMPIQRLIVGVVVLFLALWALQQMGWVNLGLRLK